MQTLDTDLTLLLSYDVMRKSSFNSVTKFQTKALMIKLHRIRRSSVFIVAEIDRIGALLGSKIPSCQRTCKSVSSTG